MLLHQLNDAPTQLSGRRQLSITLCSSFFSLLSSLSSVGPVDDYFPFSQPFCLTYHLKPRTLPFVAGLRLLLTFPQPYGLTLPLPKHSLRNLHPQPSMEWYLLVLVMCPSTACGVFPQQMSDSISTFHNLWVCTCYIVNKYLILNLSIKQTFKGSVFKRVF